LTLSLFSLLFLNEYRTAPMLPYWGELTVKCIMLLFCIFCTDRTILTLFDFVWHKIWYEDCMKLALWQVCLTQNLKQSLYTCKIRFEASLYKIRFEASLFNTRFEASLCKKRFEASLFNTLIRDLRQFLQKPDFV